MEFMGLTRNREKVQAACHVDTQQGAVIANAEIRVIFPADFVEKGFAQLGESTSVLGFYMMATDKHYAVSSCMAMVKLTPSETNYITVGDTDYVELVFPENSIVSPTLTGVKDDTLNYYCLDYFIDAGRIPAYFSYDDAIDMYETAGEVTGRNITKDLFVLEALVSLIARTSDPKVYYRQTEPGSTPPKFVAFNSVIHGPDTTSSRIIGSNFDIGLTQALIEPNYTPSIIENIQRI